MEEEVRSRIKSSTDVDELDHRRHSKPDRKFRKNGIGDQSFIRILNFNTKALLGLVVFSFFIILFLILHLMKPVEDAQRPRVVTPFPAPNIMDLPQYQGESTRRACIGEHIALRFILESAPGHPNLWLLV